MTYHSISISADSVKLLSDAIEAFLVANPTFIPVDITMVLQGIRFNAILIYAV